MIEKIAINKNEIINVNQTLPRQSQVHHGPDFLEIVKSGSSILLQSLSNESGIFPEGGFLSAAVRGGINLFSVASSNNGSGLTVEDPKAPGQNTNMESGLTQSNQFNQFWQLQKEGQLMNLEFLKIQEAISRENRVFSTISNVLKARHETTKNAINNIR